MGGGGYVGGAWLVGALEALTSVTGWQPAAAAQIVGTSAGAAIGSLYAAGLTADDLLPKFLDPADGVAGVKRSLFDLPLGIPGSWRLGWRVLRRPERRSGLRFLAACLPRGRISLEPLRNLIAECAPAGWRTHPGLRLTACDYLTGRRILLGPRTATGASLSDAVAASCAVPGLFAPVRIGSSDYVDGGVCSPSNLDALNPKSLDLAICFNPSSARWTGAASGPAVRTARFLRALSRRYALAEAAALRAQGLRVILLEPGPEDEAAMGLNPMRQTGLQHVYVAARTNMERRLRDLVGARPSKSVRAAAA